MKLIIFILLISSWDLVASETCSHPEVRRSIMHIYGAADVAVTVYHCYYAGRYPYSDITRNCINAFHTGIYIDKWNDENYVDAAHSPIKLDKYTTKANAMQNKIMLRSGTVCRYDRGFCYDPRESINFAIVWEVNHEEPGVNVEDLIEIFYGWIDTWKLRNEDLTYLVFQDSRKDRAFALELVKQGKIDGKVFWYTDRYGIIASNEGLKNIRPVPRLNQDYFPLKPKQFVSEQVLKSCDLKNFPFDLDKYSYQNYILDQNNLVTILGSFQKELLETKKKVTDKPSGCSENCTNNKAVTELQKDMRDTKKSLFEKDQEITKIRGTIEEMLKALSQNNPDISKLQENIKQILTQQQFYDTELAKIEEKLVVLQNQLSRLEDDSNGKKINTDVANLENNFNRLESTVLEKNKEIFKDLSSKDKLIDDIKSGLVALYKELHDKDIEFKKEQEVIFNRLLNIELDLNRQNNVFMEFQNYTNLILKQHQSETETNVKGKYSNILAKINLHDKEINEYKNYTTFLLSNKDKVLEAIKDNIGKAQNDVLQLEGKLKKLQDRDTLFANNFYEIDGITTKLEEAITREGQKFIIMVNETKNEIREVNEKSGQCCKAIDDLRNSNNDEIERNITDIQNILFKQNENIFQLQTVLKEIYNKLNANDKDLNGAINDCKHYVNARLQTKDEEITNLHDILIKKEKEINKLYEYFNKMDEKSKDFENKINRCKEDTDKKLKEKDDEIKRIQNNLKTKYEEFEAELKRKDQQYKILENEIKKINLNLQTVEPV